VRQRTRVAYIQYILYTVCDAVSTFRHSRSNVT